MPGIVGLVSDKPRQQCQRLVDRMVAAMLHESFYVSGTYSAPATPFYGGWVAHDSSVAARQPFIGDNGHVILLLAGELFNEVGVSFITHPDGSREVETAPDHLVRLYQKKGERCFPELNGLFSAFLIDRRSGKAFLFNDRYGVERIYWHEAEDAFYFASEAKALLSILPQLREFDLEGVSQFLDYGCTLRSRTLFRGIQKLPEASLWCFEGLKRREGKYFLPETWEQRSALTAEEFTAEFQATLERILPRYFVTDSRSAISLTGGLDSRLIMACLPETSPKPISYTFSGADRDVLDARVAARVAEVCHLEHEIIRLDAAFLSKFPLLADEAVYLTDGTLGVAGAHEVYLNRKARRFSPVRITGVFGGEIMRGVSFFKPIDLASRLLSGDLRDSLRGTDAAQTTTAKNPVSFAAFSEIPQRRFGPPAAARSQLTFRTPYLDNDFVALMYRTPQAIRDNPDFVQTIISRKNAACARIPTDRGRLGNSGYLRRALRRAAAEVIFKLDYYHSEGLPRRVSSLGPPFRKFASGIGIAGLHKFLTYGNWFASELKEYVEDGLAEARVQQNALWDERALEALIEEHRSGRSSSTAAINAVLTVSAVQRLLLTVGKFPPGASDPDEGSGPPRQPVASTGR